MECTRNVGTSNPAAQFSSRYPISLANGAVQSLTRTSGGQVPGPEKFKCFEKDDCQTCPCYDSCDKEVVADDDEDETEDNAGDSED